MPRGSLLRRARRDSATLALMAREVRAGLRARPLPSLPCKYFYDERGSALFDAITRLPEYYQTRTEEKILAACADDVIGRVRPRELVELGSGIGRKIRLLLDRLDRRRLLERCVLLDIDRHFLAQSLRELKRGYPRLDARGVVGDFTRDLGALGPGGGRLVLFLAGTVGNLHPGELPAFFKSVAAILAPGDALLLGVDLVKSKARLEAAYNDKAGVTALFNKNILRVLNRRLGASFDVAAFDHVAFYDARNAWIEMRLRANRATRARVPRAGLKLVFEAGDEIRTELSCKYTRRSLLRRLGGSGLELRRWYSDQERLFALALLVRINPASGRRSGTVRLRRVAGRSPRQNP